MGTHQKITLLKTIFTFISHGTTFSKEKKQNKTLQIKKKKKKKKKPLFINIPFLENKDKSMLN
jgi:hypothetical protein